MQTNELDNLYSDKIAEVQMMDKIGAPLSNHFFLSSFFAHEIALLTPMHYRIVLGEVTLGICGIIA